MAAGGQNHGADGLITPPPASGDARKADINFLIVGVAQGVCVPTDRLSSQNTKDEIPSWYLLAQWFLGMRLSHPLSHYGNHVLNREPIYDSCNSEKAM